MANTIILVYILSLLTIILFIWIIIIEKKLKKFLMGKDAKSLEEIIKKIYEQNTTLAQTQKQINSHLEKLDEKSSVAIRDIKTIRFNPFPDEGGKQSFATALLNDKGDGVILSSLYARDRMSIFAKIIKNGKSESELSDEEKEVLKQNE